MLSIISSGNRGCCSSTVPILEPPLDECIEYFDEKTIMRKIRNCVEDNIKMDLRDIG
jgi:hypothetical protein